MLTGDVITKFIEGYGLKDYVLNKVWPDRSLEMVHGESLRGIHRGGEDDTIDFEYRYGDIREDMIRLYSDGRVERFVGRVAKDDSNGLCHYYYEKV